MSDNINKNHYIALLSADQRNIFKLTNKTNTVKNLQIRLSLKYEVCLLADNIYQLSWELIHQDNWRWRHYQELHHQHVGPDQFVCLSPATRMLADVSLSYLHSNYQLERISLDKQPQLALVGLFVVQSKDYRGLNWRNCSICYILTATIQV